jgi:hypothetical protein
MAAQALQTVGTDGALVDGGHVLGSRRIRHADSSGRMYNFLFRHPREAGIQGRRARLLPWIPAFAGMTERADRDSTSADIALS